MKTHTLSRLVGLLLAVLAPVLQAQIPTQGQWNVNNSGVWFNTANWLNVTAPNGAGSSAVINQDFGPGRMIGDFTQTATGTGSATAQVITLTHPPVNGTIGVTDGTFFWSQARGANSTAWTVTYNGSNNQVSVAYTPAVTAGRTLVITYATTAAPMSFNEVVAVGEQVGGTDGVKTSFTRVLAYPPDATKMGVTDGTYYWHSATGVSSNNAFVVSYNATSRSVTVTYDNVANAPNGRNIVIVYWPAGTQGSYSVAVNTLGSGEPVKFTRVLNAEPVVDSNFSVASGGFSWTNGVNSNPLNFTVDFTGPRTIVGTYRNNAGLTSLATGTNGVRNVTASFTTAAAVAKNVTLGNLFMGDISGADRVDLRLNSLTLDNKDEQVQINKIIGGPDEIAGNITLDDTLALAVRTGGDVASKNSFLLSANISGAGNVVKLDSGNVVLSGNNTYSGFTSIRNTGGTVFLNSAVGNAINSQNLFLGNASRDGHTSVFLQLSGANQLADNTSIWFDGASGRNPHLKLAGFSDTIAGFTDYTGQGVIENTQDESDFNTSSVLTVNSSNNYSFNGTIRNKNSAASAGTIGLTKQGTGTQTLSGNSINYSGPTIVSGGTLVLQNISGQGNLPYNPQSQTNGAVSTGGAYGAGDVPRFRSNIANTGNVELSATVGWTFGNVISGTGTLKKTGSSNLRITNGNTYSGATTVSDGTLTLTSGVVDFATNAFTDYTTAADNNGNIGGAARLQAIYGHGALTNTTAMNLLGGTLNIANGQNRTMLAPGTSTPTNIVFNQANRVNDSAPINSAGGTINFTHTHAVELPAASYAETLGALNVQSGRTQISTSQAATGATSKLTFNSISRTTNGTVHFSGNDLSLNTRNEIAVTTAPTVYDGIIGGWATMTTINPVDNSRQLDFVKYSGGMLQALALADYTNSLSGTTNTEASWRENHNVRINGNSPDISSINGPTNSPRTINSLKFDDTTARTLILRKANIDRTLVIDTGGLISRGANHIIDRGFLTAGAAGNYELLPWVERGRTLTQSALNKIVDNKKDTSTVADDSPVRLIKSGEGILQLFGANTHTGGTTINEGVVEIKQVSAFGPEPAISKPDYLTLNSGTVEGPTVAEGSNLNIVFEPKMGITLGAQGGFFSLKNFLTVQIKSVISGPGALQMGAVGIGSDSSGGVLELSGSNSFLGAVNVTTGTLRIAGGTNTFLGPVTISSGVLEVLQSTAWPTTKPSIAISSGEFNVGANLTIGQLSGGGTVSSESATDAVKLVIDQESNSTFSGTIRESATALSLEKRGKGTLILNASADTAFTSDFRGSVNIVEGVIQANILDSRGFESSIGRGTYNAAVSGGQAQLSASQKSASNLIIGNGAALSFAGSFSQQTGRPFTIGVGSVGASILANGTSLGSTIAFKQTQLYGLDDLPIPGGYDTIEFSAPNQAAVFNLGGRNQGTNRFFMDLRDNGTGVLSVNKTGDGQWILGEQTVFDEVVTTPSRNTYTGRTTIYLGTLGVQQSGVFGAAGGDAVNLVGGNLDLRNVDYAVEENLSMAGGRLRALIGDSAWTGGVSLDVSSVVEVGTGASLRLRGPVSGKGALTKVGFGTLTLENQSSSTGNFDIQEGILRLDYSTNTGSKLPDNAALFLGGGREGAILDIVGGNGASIVEVINNMNVRLGLNQITRSDALATGTIVRLNALQDFRIAQGAALDFGASGIAQTDRLNNSAGILGSWATLNKTHWAVSAASGIDIPISGLASYTTNTWGGVNSNTDVTTSGAIAASSTTNTLRFNQPASSVLTLEGDSLLKSGGILVTPNTAAASNVIAGGRLVLENNILGGNLNVHQYGSASALTISSEIANSVNPGDMTGNMYRDSVTNRFRAPGASDGASAAAVIAANLYAGMPITGINLEPGTVIASIDYNNGNITFNQGRTADVGVPIAITTTALGSITLTGDTMVAGVQNRVRVFGTPEQLKAIASGNNISGGSTGVIPVNAIVTGVTLDNKDAPTLAILSINLNIPVPALTPLTLSFQSRNGLAKFGNGRLVLGGVNTFTGPVFINGGVLSVTQLNNGGVAGPLGAGSSLATNIQISSGSLEYVGNSVVTDRGFTINEVGSVEIARSGVVADFTGNLSGGVGAALGTLEKAGEGTLKITRVLGNADSPSSTATLPFTAATVGTGGGTNFGGLTVRNGTLQLAYENPNSNENTNRFAANTAALTMGGGTLELVGLSAVDWPGDSTDPRVTSPSENRVQQLLGQFSVNSGGSQVIVTGGSNTTTTLNLQDPSSPKDVLRQSGGTVHFVENPNGGTVAITLSIPSFFTGFPLPWATYRDTSVINRKGVNDFAAIESVDDGVINADSKAAYFIQPDVSQWPSNQPVSEGDLPFSGTTRNSAVVYLLRLFNKEDGRVNISGSLTLTGGAILVGTNVGDTVKRIEGGVLTSDDPYTINATSDLIIHNYNPSRAFKIASAIIDASKPVSLVHTGDGTTQLFSSNSYSGSTYLNGGVLRLSNPLALPGGVGNTGGSSNLVLQGGLLGLESDFTRPLGTGPQAVQFTSGGGFAAYGATRTVNFGGANAGVQWGQGGFVARGGSLKLSSYDSDATVRVSNPINLGATYRQIDVADGSASVDAELTGVLSGVGASIAKLGQGTLRVTAANTFTGGTTLAQGNLLLGGAGLGNIDMGTVDASAISDAITLQFDSGSSAARLTLGNQNSKGISTIKVSGNSTITAGVDLQRDVFVDAAAGRTLSINGTSSGTGRIRVNEGGAVSFNGTGNFGSAGGVQGAAIDGGVVVRNGIVMVGGDAGLGTANIELGDQSSSFSVATVDRSTAGRSVLQRAGEYLPFSSGLPDDVDGTGAFVFVDQATLTIDGQVYGKSDAAVVGVLGSVGKRILVNGETEHPERNGIYELLYSDGVTSATTDDIISLRRVTAFDDQTEHNYGARIAVQSGAAGGSDAGKVFFLATTKPGSLPPAVDGRVLVTTPVFWKQDVSANPNVSLLAAAAGLTIPNTVDINNTNGSGATTLGGSVNFISGSTTFTGNVQFQGQVPTAETKTLRLTSDSLSGRGAEFSGVISEADSLDSLSLVKVGAGIVTLSGDNTYKGGTQVNSGTLLVNNIAGSGTGTGIVTVSNFGSALGGTGTIAGATSLLNGAALLPGDPTVVGGVDSLTFDSSLTMGADASLWLQWTSELLADELIINGLFTADATAVIKILLEFVPLNAMTFDFIDWGSISASGGLADRLDLPALASSTLFWDTSSFSSTGELAISVRNTSGPPPVHFSIREATAREDVGTVRIAVELDWTPLTDVTVPILTSGSAAIGAVSDYTLSTTSVQLLAGRRSQELAISVRDDAASESTEKITLTIGTPTGAIKGSPTSFTLTIIDNDSGLPLADRWDLRNPLPTNETLSGLALVDSTLVAVGTKGSIFSSTDSIAWTKRPLPVGIALNAIASNSSTFVAVGENGNLVTSSNGTDWVIRSVGGGKTLTDVIWTGTQFVAVGVDGVSYNSADGFAWTFNSTNVAEDLLGLAYSAPLTQLVAVGGGGALLTSSDGGVTWVAQVSNTVDMLSSVTYNTTNLFVAVGDTGTVITSADGVNWAVGTTGSTANLRSVHWDGSQFATVGGGGAILTSTNGTSWTARTSGVTDSLETVAKLGTQLIAVGKAGTVLTSPTGVDWTKRSSGPTNLLLDVAAAGTQFVAVGSGGTLMTSPTGVTWTKQTSPVNAVFKGVAGSASLIIAVGDTGAAVKSVDGVTWTNANSGVAQNLHDIVLSGGAFYAVGDNGTALKTLDGVTWSSLVAGTVENLRSIASNGTLLLAVGANGAVISSSDAGATWSLVDIGSTATLEDITWTGSTFIAVGGGSTIFTTTDGVVWTKRAAPQLASLTSVAGSSIGALTVGLDGLAFLSTDGGATWLKRETGTSRALQGIAINAAGRFAAVGQAGSILTTEQVLPPPPSVFFTLLEQSVSEETAGVVNVEVNVSPSPATGVSITVPFSLTNPAGTATVGAANDYTSSPVSPLVFSNGQTSKIIAITVKNDNKVESNETVKIKLGTPTDNSLLATDPSLAFPSDHTLTIVDTDQVPAITDHPDNAIVALGASHTFNATSSGSGPLSLQWQKVTANIADALAVSNVNPTVASYTIPSVSILSGGTYRLKASNPVTPAGVFSTAASLVVVDTGDKLVLQKQNLTAVLTANVGGTATAYRWFKGATELADTADLAGTGTKTLSIKTLVVGEEGDDYRCRVTSAAGDLFTGNHEVRIGQTPQITSPPVAFPAGAVGKPYAPYDVLTQHFNTDVHFTPTKWVMTGAPTGLSISASGVISGIPQVSITVDTAYQVKVTASNITGLTASFTAPMVITNLTPNAIGSFVGLVDRSGTFAGGTGTLNLGGRLDLTTTSNAKFTGSLMIGTTTLTKYPITGLLDTSGANPTATVVIPRTGGKSTLTLTFVIDTAANLVTGSVTDTSPTTASLNGWRNVWKIANPNINQSSAYDGRHNVMAAIPESLEGDIANPTIPQGDSFFSIVVDLGGKATVSGTAADGSVIATSAQIGPNGEVLVYQALYATTAMGSFIGRLDIDSSASSQPVTGIAAWNKPAQLATAANLYRSGFGQVINLEINGGLYTPPPATTIIMGADPSPIYNAGMTFFSDEGLKASPTATNDPNLPEFRLNTLATFVKPVPNLNAHALVFAPSTGLFSGSFKLTDTASAARTVAYSGLVIPDTGTPSLLDGMGVGHFILKPFTTTATAAQKSGRVTIVPVLEP